MAKIIKTNQQWHDCDFGVDRDVYEMIFDNNDGLKQRFHKQKELLEGRSYRSVYQHPQAPINFYFVYLDDIEPQQQNNFLNDQLELF